VTLLLPEEQENVRKALFDVLNLQQNPRSFLGLTVFGTNREKIPGEVPFLTTVVEYVEAVLTVCLRYGSTPPLLVTLLDFLIQDGAGALAAIRLRIQSQAAAAPVANPYEDRWLATLELPFFDRAMLRQHLQLLVTGSASPILRVRAPAGTFGRTYTTRLVEHVARSQGDTVRVLYSLVGPDQGPTHQVTDLATALLEPLAPGAPPDRSSSSYPGAIARWILTQLSTRAEAFVMVLDGYGQPQVNPEVRETIDALATLVTTGEHRTRHRLVLLDYEHPLPVSAADVIEEVLLPPEQVTEGDLHPAIEAIGRIRQLAGLEPIPAADVPMLATAIAAMAPPGGRERLVALNAALAKMATFERPNP
jgi:hypothetical protein